MKKHKNTYEPGMKRRDLASRHAGMRGFAMMDVAFGAAILGIVVMGTLNIFEFGQRQIGTRVAERSAYDLANMRIEELIAQGFDNSAVRTDSGLTVTGGIPATRTTTLTWIDDPADSTGAGDSDGPEDFKNFEVTVEYGSTGNTKTVSLSTILIP